mgnify:CR=1 FL=1
MQTSEPAERIDGSRLADKTLARLNFIGVNLFNSDILRHWKVALKVFLLVALFGAFSNNRFILMRLEQALDKFLG